MPKSPYHEFPSIFTNGLVIRKIIPSDVDSLFELYRNESLFQYSPVMLRKNKETVTAMIGHFERDFLKKKAIFLGIALQDDPDLIVGVAELFDYDSNVNMITIGYRLNDRFWGRGIAAKTVGALVRYLFLEIGINRIQAFVMPPNIKSANVLKRNHFTEEGMIRQGHVWKGHGVVDLMVFSLLKCEYEAAMDEQQ